MTNWRELGLVPNSDGEDSDAELSTQDEIAEDGVATSEAATAQHEGLGEDTIMNDAASDEYVDINQTPKELPETSTGQILPIIQLANQSEPRLNEAVKEEQRNGREILVVDLSDQPGTPEDSLQLVRLRRETREASIEESRHIQCKKNIVLQGVENLLEISREQSRLSPDPITSEEQVFPQKQDEGCTILPKEAWGSYTPMGRKDFRQPGPVIDSSSMIDSSPLSSVSSTGITPSPPAAPQQLTALEAAFQIVIPLPCNKNNQQCAAPIRNFRERKPIQKNPYLIEGERFRQTLKSRGVRPWKRVEVETEVNSVQGADMDSQEGDYVVPPEPSHRRKRVAPPVEVEIQLDGEENTEDYIPSSTNSPRERVRPNDSLSSGTKRRKVIHTYLKCTSASNANETLGNLAQSKENTRSLVAIQTGEIAIDTDIYDLPTDSSPARQRLPRRALANQPVPNSGEQPTNIMRGPIEKRRGILAVMDYDLDSDSDPSELNLIAQPVLSARISPITIPSSPPHSTSENEQVEGDGEDEDEDEDEDDEEDESQTIRKFQRKTTGVLPASWWKLDKNQQIGGGSGVRRGARNVLSPAPDIISRPGVARAKISSRARSPNVDVFLMGDDGDSDMSSDEPVIVSSALAKDPTREKDEWVDLDDIIEDDRIDRMLPDTSRKGITQKKRKNRAVNNVSSHRDLTTSSGGGGYTPLSRQGNNVTRLHQLKISNHVQPRRKPTKGRKQRTPRVGILDVVQRYQATTAAPPTFIKLAERRARERRDQGRQSPSRKLFVLETDMGTKDVQAVLRDWREGTLSIADQSGLSKSYGGLNLDRRRAYEHGTSGHQFRLASPQRLGGSQVHPSGRLAGPLPSTTKPSQPKRQEGRQTTLSNIVRREPVSKKLTSTTRPWPKSQMNPVTSRPRRGGSATHAPNFAPQVAQFQAEKPMNHTLRRLHQVPQRHTTPDLATLLRNTTQRNPHLARFMEDDDLVQPMPRATPAVRNISVPGQSSEVTAPPKPVPRVRRKRTPRRVDADTIERRQPPLHDIVIDDAELHIPDELSIVNQPILQGLLQYGNNYSLTFDTVPLKPGTIFNSHTFIGDGGLSRALNTPPVKENRGILGSSFTFGDKIMHWGLYEDSIAAEFESIMDKTADAAEKAQGKNELDGTELNSLASQLYSFSQFFSNYLARVISFPDSIDIISFGQRVLQALDVCCDRALTIFGGNSLNPNPKNASTRLKLHLLTFSLVFTFQIYRLASQDAEIQTRLEIKSTVRRTGQRLLSQLLKCGVDGVRACYEDQRQRSKHERGIDQDHYIAEAWVIAIQILDGAELSNAGFWQLFNLELRPTELERAFDIRVFEKSWRIIFTILPLHQFDTLGIVSRASHPTENWTLLRTLISRPLKVYNSYPEGHSGTIINYCRVLYARCHHLISLWGWTNPDLIIPTLYEFFARNSLANLKNEKGYRSAEFLQDLEKEPSLVVQDSDRCFHLLLKTVAIGIKKMETISTTRKIGGIVNRLMPNHRRQYPKEEMLRIEHLNALRNHHDLLATLYWAAPPNCRPPLDAVRDLVDPETSHLQACNVSIRTWSNLLRFKLHSGENPEGIKPFIEWFDEIVSRILNQHNTARSEAEKIFKAAKDKGNTDLSEDVLERNIRSNQKQLEDILINAVKCLNTALSGIVGQVKSAVTVLTKSSTSNILNSYNRLSHKLVIEALQLVRQYLHVCKNKEDPPPPVVPVDEDSQDYGDWSGFDELVVQDVKKPAAEHLLVTVYDSLHRMLSNCFGADKQPEENLLVEVVDTWALVIEFLVQSGFKQWDTYLDSYSSESWSSLRDTEQTRKFTAYFMLKIIQTEASVYEENKATFISFWLQTLVERESMLKFQNRYTAELLNRDPKHPIFENLPFARDEPSGYFSITPADFRLRRLSLISTVLANMRESYEATRDESPTKAESLKQEYSEMLKSMMKSMKDNYQETKTVFGAYVEFVQQVVGYLQQHTVDLVNVDGFFTNPNSFPLPATDPTYVIGKLKNYGLKLHSQRGQKQLTSFFQSVCERAAVDGQQGYLVSQLTTALSGNFEDGDPTKPTLRAFFIEVIFPAYVECTFREPYGWILAVPILKAMEQIIMMMREDIDSTFYPCVKSVLSMLTSLLEGMRLSVSSMEPLEISSPSVLGPLTIMLSSLSRAIPLIDWLSESGNSVNDLTEVASDCACFLIKYSGYIRDLVENRETQMPIDMRANQIFEGRYGITRRDYTILLKNSFKKEWSSYGGSWFVVRGAKRSEVNPPIMYGEQEGLESQNQVFIKTVENLVKVACRTQRFEPVGWSVDARIWEYEGRGMPHSDGVRGRKHGRALRALGSLFC